MHILIKNKKLYINHYKVKCAIGKRGISSKKKEGDLKTPKGKFKILYVLYRKDRVPKINTKIPKIQIKKNMGWCDDPKSKKYNKLIRFPLEFSAEKIFRRDNIYDIILVLNYNMKPVVKNKGSAIFIHVAKKDYKSTRGCIAISKKKIKTILNYINKRTIVKIG